MKPEVYKRAHYYLVEKIYTEIVFLLLPFLGKTPITPNMVTCTNILICLTACSLVWKQHFITAAILVQIYSFLDALDGNLARYKNMQSALGKKLDWWGDRIFYNGFFALAAYISGTHFLWIVVYLIVFNGYGAIATYYIVPRIRRIGGYKRFGVKKILLDKGILLGMEISIQDVIASVMLITSYRSMMLPVITILYCWDMCYRLYELYRNH